jgi:hypothetical protein
LGKQLKHKRNADETAATQYIKQLMMMADGKLTKIWEKTLYWEETCSLHMVGKWQKM